MRKNKMMRAAAGLLVATLLTTSVISGTFAKYTTSADGTDTARVAKWGVKVTANGKTFADTYSTDDKTVTAITNSVVGTGTQDKDKEVVAPGTKGTMASMTLSGTPEVAVKVSYEGKFALNDKWTVGDDNTFYCPLVIKVNDTEIKGSEQNTAKDFADAVNNAIKGYSKEYAAGTKLEEKGTDSLKVSWSWDYDADSKGTNDVKDTALGDAAANATDDSTNAATVTLAVTTTVTQID